VDPVEIINKYGADSLRFMLVTGNTPGNDLRFFDERVESARNFANKIWNASRFLLMNLEGFDPTFKPTPNDLELADKWILQKLAYQIETVTENLERFELGEAARQLYELIWFNFCDYYIELAKARLYGDDPRAKATALFVLTKVLEVTLRLLHPFMPFLTEVIRQKLPNVQGSIMLAPWPTRDEFKDFIKANDDTKKAASLIFNTVRTIRNLKSELGIDSRKKAAVVLKVTNAADKKILAENLRYLTDLTFAEPITFAEEKPAHAMSGVIDGAEIYLPLAGLIDTEKEIARLTKELEKIRKGAASTAGKLNNERFVSKAPAEVVQAERDKLSAAEEKISSLEQRIKQLENL
ncbi:MAG: class I tRNA ligase family protein, partial [Selenomonadaceae bacterium]|nr:class I tRNA ligase family protein [Selenomonadaceae bacterium]